MNMVERVARAISKAHHENPDDCAFGYKIKQLWELRITDAHAAIAAAFQVTNEDAKAFFGVSDAKLYFDVRDCGRPFKWAMQALSDAALYEDDYSEGADPPSPLPGEGPINS